MLPAIAQTAFWGVVQSVNFHFVPLRLGALLVERLRWQTYVSWVASRAAAERQWSERARVLSTGT